MNLFHAIVLGLVQGLTEFLPVSSSGHLRIVPAFLGWDDPGTAFTAVIQLGTMAAVLLYFAADIKRVLGAWLAGLFNASKRDNLDYRMGWMIVLGTIPISLIGLVFRHQISSGGRNLYIIGTMLIVFGVVLALADRFGSQRREVEQMTVRDGFLIGVAQTLALIPGVSRSGSTISAGLAFGLTRAAAARYSFLLSIPAVVLSGLFELKDIGGADSPGLVPTLVATVVAFVVGYASIAFLLRYLERHTVYVFSAYRIVLGAVVLALVASNTIS